MSERQSEAELFEKCLKLPIEEQERYLRTTCGGDKQLVTRVLRLIRADKKAGGFLESLPDEDSVEVANELQRIAPSEEGAGDQIGRFRLIELIGEGAHGSVWLAEQTQDIKRTVALKILKLGMDTKQFLARFEVEKQVLAMLDHPGVAKVLDAGATTFGRPYFVMELVEGKLLLEYMDDLCLEINERLTLFVQLCQALGHAHRRGIVHRDLKPSNILVSLAGRKPVPKIIDFGIAKSLENQLTEETLLTGIHTFIGTPEYSSPEQLSNSGEKIGLQSDIYSLGCLLYEILCGRTPFKYDRHQGKGLDDFRKRVLEITPPYPSRCLGRLKSNDHKHVADVRGESLSKLTNQLSGDLDYIVLKCLEKKPNRRYESAENLIQDLRAYLDGQPVSAVAPSINYRIRKYITRKRPVYSLGLEIALVVVVILAVVSFFLPNPFDVNNSLQVSKTEESLLGDRSIVVLPFENLSPDPDNALFADGVYDNILANLSIIPGLRIITKSSALNIRGNTKTSEQIGLELKVRYLVDGSVRKSGENIEVQVQLVDTQTGSAIWTDSFKQDIDEFFAMEASIAKAIAEKLDTVLTPKDIANLERRPTNNQNAYENYLKSKTAIDAEKIAYLETAVKLDPDFAEAWASLANTYMQNWRWVNQRRDPNVLDRARDAIAEVERLRPQSTMLLEVKSGYAYRVNDDDETSIRYLLAARAKGSKNMAAGLMSRYTQIGRIDEADLFLDEAFLTDPLSPRLNWKLLEKYERKGNWDKAAALLNHNLEITKDDNSLWRGSVKGSYAYWLYRTAHSKFLETGDVVAWVNETERIPGFTESPDGQLWSALIKRNHQEALNILSQAGLAKSFSFTLTNLYSKIDRQGFSLEPFSLLKALVLFELGNSEKLGNVIPEAKAYIEEVIAAYPKPDPDFLASLALCFALEGNRDQFEAILPEIRALNQNLHWQYRRQAECELKIACGYVVLGNHDTAIETLDAAKRLDSRTNVMLEVKLWFIFDRLRAYDRFHKLLNDAR